MCSVALHLPLLHPCLAAPSAAIPSGPLRFLPFSVKPVKHSKLSSFLFFAPHTPHPRLDGSSRACTLLEGYRPFPLTYSDVRRPPQRPRVCLHSASHVLHLPQSCRHPATRSLSARWPIFVIYGMHSTQCISTHFTFHTSECVSVIASNLFQCF